MDIMQPFSLTDGKNKCWLLAMVFLTACRFTRSRGPDPFWRRQMYFRMAWRYYGRSRNCWVLALRRVHKALKKATLARQLKKIQMRKLWGQRINAGCYEHGCEKDIFLEGIAQSNIGLNKQMLAQLAIYEPRTFKSLVDLAKKQQLEAGITQNGLVAPSGVITRGML
ncbi:unnamed protein product [Owenia fusiformis]|uniref:Large ribosomal subunit protein bL20m n=1 Tax=Owenia fusiformis TaxID=6347 RepID=A0A8S4N4S5_OWEFU|nr:unnamed protein product [Owenia fusiformis]